MRMRALPESARQAVFNFIQLFNKTENISAFERRRKNVQKFAYLLIFICDMLLAC